MFMKPIRLAFVTAALLLALLIPLSVSAEVQSYSVQYTIADEAVSASIAISLNENTPQFEWLVPEDAGSLETSHPYSEIVELEDSRKVEFGNSLDAVTIKYNTALLLQHAGGTSFFIADVPPTGAADISVTVALPEGATLKHSVDSPVSSFVPQSGRVSTDGRRIIVSWDESDFLNGNSILVMYDARQKGMAWPLLAIAGVILVGVLVLVYSRRKGMIKQPQIVADTASLTKNLFEEEKKIVELLLAAKGSELWQKQIEISTGFPKVTLSRKLRSLEQKGLIEKIPYGNANKIRLRKAQSA